MSFSNYNQEEEPYYSEDDIGNPIVPEETESGAFGINRVKAKQKDLNHILQIINSQYRRKEVANNIRAKQIGAMNAAFRQNPTPEAQEIIGLINDKEFQQKIVDQDDRMIMLGLLHDISKSLRQVAETDDLKRRRIGKPFQSTIAVTGATERMQIDLVEGVNSGLGSGTTAILNLPFARPYKITLINEGTGLAYFSPVYGDLGEVSSEVTLYPSTSNGGVLYSYTMDTGYPLNGIINLRTAAATTIVI